jgi:multiple sugar transport system permease protein
VAAQRRSLFYSLSRQENLEGWLFVFPLMLGLVVFVVLPTFGSFLMSLYKWDIVSPAQWIGGGNYERIFTQDHVFGTVLVNTIYYAVLTIPLSMVGGLILAMLVNQQLPGSILFRSLFFFPVVTSDVAIAVVWSWMFSAQFGLINNVMESVGLPALKWLGSTVWAMPAVAIVSIWFRVGYNMILYLAGLQGVPEQLYEVASIDGASAWAKFYHVTLPLLTPTTFFVLVTSVINSFQIFGLIYIMTEGGPGYATSVYVYYLYQTGFRFFRMGYASALSVILFAIVALVTLVQWRMSKKWVFYG